MNEVIEYLENNTVVPQMTILDTNMKTIVEQYKPMVATNVSVDEKSHNGTKYYTLSFSTNGVDVTLTKYVGESEFVKWVIGLFKKSLK